MFAFSVGFPPKLFSSFSELCCLTINLHEYHSFVSVQTSTAKDAKDDNKLQRLNNWGFAFGGEINPVKLCAIVVWITKHSPEQCIVKVV